jgi:hypothetical protein
MNDDGLDELAQRCDKHGFVEFRSLCGDVGQTPDVGEITLDRRRVDGDDLGSGRDLCELGLDALPFGRELIDLRVVGVEIGALRNVRDQAIDLAVPDDGRKNRRGEPCAPISCISGELCRPRPLTT